MTGTATKNRKPRGKTGSHRQLTIPIASCIGAKTTLMTYPWDLAFTDQARKENTDIGGQTRGFALTGSDRNWPVRHSIHNIRRKANLAGRSTKIRSGPRSTFAREDAALPSPDAVSLRCGRAVDDLPFLMPRDRPRCQPMTDIMVRLRHLHQGARFVPAKASQGICIEICRTIPLQS